MSKIKVEDYEFLAWENKNFAEYLEKALGFDQETIDLIAQGGLPMLKKFEKIVKRKN